MGVEESAADGSSRVGADIHHVAGRRLAGHVFNMSGVDPEIAGQQDLLAATDEPDSACRFVRCGAHANPKQLSGRDYFAIVMNGAPWRGMSVMVI